MASRTGIVTFLAANALVWLLMTAILVVVPDTIDRWVGLELARVIGWAVACGLWVVTIEGQWKRRFGPFTRFVCQLVLWVLAAVVAMWISEHAKVSFMAAGP